MLKQGGAADKRQLATTQNYEASSVGKNFKPIDEKLEVKPTLEIGSRVVIVGGSHKGLEGKVVALSKQKQARMDAYGMSTSQQQAQGGDQIDPDSYVSVELRAGGSKVEVKRKRLELKSQRKKHRSRSRDNSPQNVPSHSREAMDGESGHHQTKQEESKRSQKPLKWVAEGIQVRVISKKAADGILYNKVLPVVTVLDRCTFEVFSRELNREFTCLREKDIETVLPRSKELEGNPTSLEVLIVRGDHKGQSGQVRSIDKKKDRVEILVDYCDIVTVS